MPGLLLYWKAREQLRQMMYFSGSLVERTEDTQYAAEAGGVGGASTAGL